MTDRERLIKLIDGFVFGTQIIVNNIEWDSTKVKELADYLIANGVILPPCKVGDAVYYITGIHNLLVGSARVEEIYYNGDGFAYRACTNNDVRFDVQEEETYYTREEAEKALERS